MAEQLPTLQHSETDGNGPAKRRRRPALSCVECRMRKVKCDREEPCGACTRIKSSTCTYRTQPRAGIRSAKSPADASTSTNGSAGHEGSPRSSPQPYIPLDNFEWAINRYIAPGLFGAHSRPQLAPLPSDRQTVNLGDSSLISDLAEKVGDIEKQLSILSTDGALGLTSLPIRDTTKLGSSSAGKLNMYGDSHLKNFLDHGDKGTAAVPETNRTEVNKSTELYVSIASVKRINRAIRSNHRLKPFIDPEVLRSIPSKDVCDELVHCYLRTFEGVFRVLHIPSFLKEYESYWSGTALDKPSIILKIILVCAIGVSFYSGPNIAHLRAASTTWIQAAGTWLSAPHEKTRLNMAGIQIHILLLLARQVCNVDGDMIWIPAGALLRAAMQLGLHRDPEYLEEESIFLTEMRRRLWATVLEFTAQSSLDMGMPPMISPADYDTRPPSNVNDEDIGEDITTFAPKPSTEFTQSSIQIAFTQTLPIRLEIIRLINNLRFELSYDMTVRLSTELSTISREKTAFFQPFLNSNPGTTPFQIKLLDTLTRRFILCLHRPFFRKAKENPQYHYSRKICLETSLTMHTPATEPVVGQEDDWTKMSEICAGFFKSFFLYSTSTIYLELVTQIEEQRQDTTLFAPLTSTTTASPYSLPPQFQTLRNVLERASKTAEARLRNGETNGKAVVFIYTALARIDALAAGADPVVVSVQASKNAAQRMTELMKVAYREEWGEEIELTSPMDQFAERSQWPAQSADNVVGQDSHLDLSGFTPMQGGFGGIGATMGGAQPTGMASWENMDLDAFMQDIEIDYSFGGSPERWYNSTAWDGSDITGGSGTMVEPTTMGMTVPGVVPNVGL